MRGFDQAFIDAHLKKMGKQTLGNARETGTKGNKNHARAKVDNRGIKHQSTFECDRINDLYLLEHAGLITGLEIEPKGVMVDQLTYKPDAMFCEVESNRWFLYEAKGRILPRWRCVLTEFKAHGARRGNQRFKWLRVVKKVKSGVSVEDVEAKP